MLCRYRVILEWDDEGQSCVVSVLGQESFARAEKKVEMTEVEIEAPS